MSAKRKKEINCEYVRDKMFELYTEELSTDERKVYAEHISSCKECAAEYDDIKNTIEYIRKSSYAPEKSISKAVTSRLKRIGFLSSWTVKWVSAAASVIIIVAAAVIIAKFSPVQNMDLTISEYGEGGNRMHSSLNDDIIDSTQDEDKSFKRDEGILEKAEETRAASPNSEAQITGGNDGIQPEFNCGGGDATADTAMETLPAYTMSSYYLQSPGNSADEDLDESQIVTLVSVFVSQYKEFPSQLYVIDFEDRNNTGLVGDVASIREGDYHADVFMLDEKNKKSVTKNIMTTLIKNDVEFSQYDYVPEGESAEEDPEYAILIAVDCP